MKEKFFNGKFDLSVNCFSQVEKQSNRVSKTNIKKFSQKRFKNSRLGNCFPNEKVDKTISFKNFHFIKLSKKLFLLSRRSVILFSTILISFLIISLLNFSTFKFSLTNFSFIKSEHKNNYSSAETAKKYIEDYFPHYPTGTPTFSAENNKGINLNEFKKIIYKEFNPKKINLSIFENNPKAYHYQKVKVGSSYTFRKNNLRIQNIKNGNPLTFKSDIVLKFSSIEKKENKIDDLVLIVNKNSKENTFLTYNIKKIKLEISFEIKENIDKVYHFAMGFTDIDTGQALSVDSSALQSSNNIFHNKYYFGSSLRKKTVENYLRFDGTINDNSSDKSLALLGINLKNKQKADFIFETDSAGITLFKGKYMNSQNPSPDINSSLKYYLPFNTNERHFVSSNGLKTVIGKNYSYIEDTTLKYGSNYTAKKIQINETVKEIKNSKGEVTGLSFSSFKFENGKDWCDDKTLKEKSFNKDGKKFVYWFGEKKIYPKFTEDRINFPKIKVEDAAVDMNMKGGYKYRTGTDVIFSVKVTEGGGADVTLQGITLTFKALGNTFAVKNIYMPKGKSQLAFIKFNTGEIPTTESITVFGSYIFKYQNFKKEIKIDEKNLKVTISKQIEKLPPNPKAGDLKPKSFSLNCSSDSINAVSKSWQIYNFKNNKFSKNKYTIKIKDSKCQLISNKYVKTAKNNGTEIKAGYGVDAIFTSSLYATLNNNSLANNNISMQTSPIQRINFLFPEFNYQTYNRLSMPLDQINLQDILKKNTFHFKINADSNRNQNVHFTPVWFPDGDYKVVANCGEAWTPVGEIYSTVYGVIKIKNDLFKDYYVKGDLG